MHRRPESSRLADSGREGLCPPRVESRESRVRYCRALAGQQLEDVDPSLAVERIVALFAEVVGTLLQARLEVAAPQEPVVLGVDPGFVIVMLKVAVEPEVTVWVAGVLVLWICATTTVTVALAESVSPRPRLPWRCS